MSDWFDVAFGADKAGLTSVHFRLYGSDGADVVARTSAGVTEVGNGAYGALISVAVSAVGIEWDTGEAAPVYAHESLTQYRLLNSLTVNGALSVLQDTRLRELHQIYGLESGSPLTVRPTSRAVASITQSIVGDPSASVTVTRT